MESDDVKSDLAPKIGNKFIKKFTKRPEKGKKVLRFDKPKCGNLSRVTLCWPEDKESNETVNLPASFTSNSDKEKIALWYAENFRQQVNARYPTRAPLLLAARNECGIQKLVCTSLRPTALPYPELGDWQGIARFVADHLRYEPLADPTQLAGVVCSSRLVLQRQSGHCLELSCVLGSLLLGAGYNALVVSGHATREQSLHDQTREPCPYLPRPGQKECLNAASHQLKYQVKPSKRFKSQFLVDMEARAVQRIKEEEKRRQEAEAIRIAEEEKTAPDVLEGRRVHCWVLILPGDCRHDVKTPFYIEPASGNPFDLEDLRHTGVEYLWNHQNFWVNLQNKNCRKLNFDFNDRRCWISLLNEVESDLSRRLDMPMSWMEKITISGAAYTTRYPGGKKIILYLRARLELFAELSRSDGLISRVTQYSDLTWSDALREISVYKYRKDYLQRTEVDLKTQQVIDYYIEGRKDHIKDHEYFVSGDQGRKLSFYSKSHPDGLSGLQLHPGVVIERFMGHKDWLDRRTMHFVSQTVSNAQRQEVKLIIEELLVNTVKPVHQQLAQRKFFHQENKIFLTFHHAPDQITAGYIHFIKPTCERKISLDNVHEYQPISGEMSEEPELRNLMEMQIKAEIEAVNHAEKIHFQIKKLLNMLSTDRADPGLKISVFDDQRNQDLVQTMQIREREEMDDAMSKLMDPVDPLAPLLARKGDLSLMTEEEIMSLQQQCLEEAKHSSVERHNALETKLEKLSNELISVQKPKSGEPDDKEAKITLHMQALCHRLKRMELYTPMSLKEIEQALLNHPSLKASRKH